MPPQSPLRFHETQSINPKNPYRYAETIPIFNEAVHHALPQIPHLGTDPELPVAMAECLFLHGHHPHPEHPLQNRYPGV